MKKSISKLIILNLLVLLTGCAATYRPINPPALSYNSHDLQDGIGLSYKHDVLRERGNRKYANKEEKKRVKLIAIKVTNNTDSAIRIGRDAAFYSGQNQIFPMDPMSAKESIKQYAAGYLPYLILSFLTLNIYEGTSVESYPIGLAIGPGLTIGNMVMAASANDDLLKELYDYNLLNREIQKRETVFGIIAIRESCYGPIAIKMIR